MSKVLRQKNTRNMERANSLATSSRMNGRPNGKGAFTFIDLFCGAGGLTLGFVRFKKGTFRPLWANDFNKYAASTYNTNFGNHCVIGDLVSILDDPKTKIPFADLVIGGPPCQGFSLLNKNKHHDPRKELWRPFFEMVERSNAKIFLMENVPQILGSMEYIQIEQEAKRQGFSVTSAILNAADYGVPQRRQRAFVLGCKFAEPGLVFPPKKTHFDPSIGLPQTVFGIDADFSNVPKPWRTVRDVISDLPKPQGTEIRKSDSPFDLHFGRNPTPMSLKRYKSIPNQGMNRFDLQKRAPELTPPCWIRKKSGGTDLFGRLWWDRPAFTIRTEFFKPEKGRYLHPLEHRPITHREAARLQSFPDDFKFEGTKIEIAKQIGNAVPPLLAEVLANCVVELMELKERGIVDRRILQSRAK